MTSSTPHLEYSYTTINLSVFALNTWLYDARMTKDDDRRGSNEPEEGSEGGCPEEERDPNHAKTSVERLLGDCVVAELKRVRAKLVDQRKTSDEENEGSQQPQVIQNGINSQDQDDQHVIPREVPGIV